MPNSADFSIYAGDSRSLTITVKDPSGNIVNLTGATIKWVLVDAGGNSINAKDSIAGGSGGITINNATAGQCTIQLASADTMNLLTGSYTHEARMIDSANNSSIIFKGTITVNASNV